jgi:hypothetical protein
MKKWIFNKFFKKEQNELLKDEVIKAFEYGWRTTIGMHEVARTPYALMERSHCYYMNHVFHVKKLKE